MIVTFMLLNLPSKGSPSRTLFTSKKQIPDPVSELYRVLFIGQPLESTLTTYPQQNFDAPALARLNGFLDGRTTEECWVRFVT